MSQEDARKFVARMKANPVFRNKVIQVNGPEELYSCLRQEGMLFDQLEFVNAMAECMEQMEQEMKG